jgi:hypothetical protein
VILLIGLGGLLFVVLFIKMKKKRIQTSVPNENTPLINVLREKSIGFSHVQGSNNNEGF